MIGQTDITLTTEIQQLITAEQAWHYRVVPQPEQINGKLQLFVDSSQDQEEITNELQFLLCKSVLVEPLPPESIQKALSSYYRKGKQGLSQKSELASKNDFLESLIAEARKLNSSDIHIECFEERCRVRFRIDGLLIERYVIDKNRYPEMVNKLKVKARLDIAEKRLPQDGRIFFKGEGEKFDIRVSVLPSLHGEKIVLRLLGSDAANIDITQLGFGKEQLHSYLEAAKQPNGIILISGPTGSGKTTTLYATLKELNDVKRNIVTVEDPIEYTLEGVTQVQVRDNIGLTFAKALRSFLRQDPDVIMLGEIRDGETANMAIRAALTGHLVLSTIHTNSAWGTISRLTDMGVPPYLVAGTLKSSVAQRLIRLLCKHCRIESDFDASLYPSNFQPPKEIKTHFMAQGCEECFYSGYTGRTAIYEVLSIDYALGDAIREGKTFKEYNSDGSITRLPEQAFQIFTQGKTSLEEVYPLLMQQNL